MSRYFQLQFKVQLRSVYDIVIWDSMRCRLRCHLRRHIRFDHFLNKYLLNNIIVKSLLSPWLPDASVSQGSVSGGVCDEKNRKRNFTHNLKDLLKKS